MVETRREFLRDGLILVFSRALYPVTFPYRQEIAKPDFRYKDVLNEIFNKTIEKGGEKITYDKCVGYIVEFKIKDTLYRSNVLDVDGNSEFHPYVDFGYLKSMRQSLENGKTLANYAEIFLGRALGVNTTEIIAKFDSNYFKKLIRERTGGGISKKDAALELLHEVDTYNRYGMSKFEKGKFDIDSINRGEDIALDPESKILTLYKEFAEHFGVDPKLPNMTHNQV